MMPVTLPINLLSTFLDKLLVEPASLFLRAGQNMFLGLALILLVWHGIELALGGLDAVRTGRLLLTISFVFAMIHFYDQPIPGIGYSFTDMFRVQTLTMASQLSGPGAASLDEQARVLMLSVPIPPLMQIHVAAVYLMVYILAALLTIAAFCVIAYGAIGQAVCLVLGPIFIPWYLAPRLDFLFWSWFKATLQFSFYKVVAAIVIEIVAQIQQTMLSPGAATTGVGDFMLQWPIRAAACLVSCLLIFHIPSLTNSFFSGAAGGGGVIGSLTATALVVRNFVSNTVRGAAAAGTGGAAAAATAAAGTATRAASGAAKGAAEGAAPKDAAATVSHSDAADKHATSGPATTKPNGGDR